jgi:hypothetical protein
MVLNEWIDGTGKGRLETLTVDGAGIWGVVEPVSPAADDVKGADIAADTSGNVHVAYVTSAQQKAVFRPTAGAWDSAEVLRTGTPEIRVGVDLAVGATGAAAATFYSDPSGLPSSATGTTIFLARRPVGGPWAASTAMSDTTTPRWTPPLVAVEAGGETVVAWENTDTDFQTLGVKVRRVSATGVAGAEESVGGPTDGMVDLEAVGSNTFLTTWRYTVPTPGGPVVGGPASIFRRTDSDWVSEFTIPALTTSDRPDPEIVALFDGGVAAQWYYE